MVTLLDCSKAFDMVRFSTLFKKLSVAGVPPIVIRVLAYVYEEQFAWVKWGESKSRQFKIVNGTRQGSVLSPALFSLYMDELLVELRKLGVGCHISGVFFGAALYADDLVLIAPSRSALQRMLDLCEQYASDHNLVFSTDPNPASSKSKSLYMVGKTRGGQIQYPKPVRLCGTDLPWVSSANHLGHTLHQDCSMEGDARTRRMAFISESLDIRELFSWAHPMQILQAVQVYCSSFYGSMLYDLYGDEAGMIFRCWNTATKLAWQVPRGTFTFLVHSFLTGDFPSLRESLLTRYVAFLQGLSQTNKKEIRILCCTAISDGRSTSGRNYRNIAKETRIRLKTSSKQETRNSLEKPDAPKEEEWRIRLLARLLHERTLFIEEDAELVNVVCSSTFE